MNAIILCGGLSTRLGDITKSIPKILLPVGDRLVLDWQLEKLHRLGIRDVVLAAGHLAEVLKDAVGSERHGTKLMHAIEPERLGTGGAIRFAWRFAFEPEAPTWVLNGDILTTADFTAMASQLQPASDGIILASHVPDASSYGTLEVDIGTGRLLSFKEKQGKKEPGPVNSGIYLLTSQARTYFPNGPSSVEYDVFPKMKNLYVFASDAPWIDIGVPERLMWAREHWQIFLET